MDDDNSGPDDYDAAVDLPARCSSCLMPLTVTVTVERRGDRALGRESWCVTHDPDGVARRLMFTVVPVLH